MKYILLFHHLIQFNSVSLFNFVQGILPFLGDFTFINNNLFTNGRFVPLVYS